MASFFAAHLPLEILQQIVCQLDPISLIALSQASKSWRALINPLRHDHIQRMLALELLPEHGGIVPLFDEQTITSTPPWDSDEWKSNKYACCRCMKLRSHMMFSNSAILRRPYRKPPPGNVEAAKAAVTDWEPLEPSARWRRIQERAAREQAVRARWARAADHHPDPANPWLRVPRDEETYAAIAKYLVGTARHKRRCIDCELRYGNWVQLNMPPRFAWVPVVKSRQLKFKSNWDRHFPGLIEPLPPEKYPRQWRGIQGSSDGIYLTLYIIRCPCCSTWQEQSAFRKWELYRWGFRSPRRTRDPLLCNRCHLEAYEDPALLARELSAGALEMLRSDQKLMLYHLEFGWRLVDRDFNAQGTNSPLAKYAAVGDEILDGLKWTNASRDSIVVDESELPDLRRRFVRYRNFIRNEVDPETRAGLLQSWFGLWVEDYDLFESKYRWLGRQIARLESDPNLVLNYVLERDPYRVSP